MTNSVDHLVCSLIGSLTWLVRRMIGWSTGWLVGLSVGWLGSWSVGFLGVQGLERCPWWQWLRGAVSPPRGRVPSSGLGGSRLLPLHSPPKMINPAFRRGHTQGQGWMGDLPRL